MRHGSNEAATGHFVTRYVEEELVVPTGMSPHRLFSLCLLGLAFFLTGQAFELKSYISRDTRPPSRAETANLELALDYHKALAKDGVLAVFMHTPRAELPVLPPLYPAALSRIYDAGDPAAAALWINWFYMAILALSVFGITYAFRPGAEAAAAAVIFCLSPVVHRLYHVRTVDLAMLAWVAAGYWALVKSAGFRRWAGSLAFGAVFAVGMLHKTSYGVYLLPGIYYWLKGLEKVESRRKALMTGVLAAAFLPWWFFHIQEIAVSLFQPSFALPAWKAVADSLGPQFWIAGALSWLIGKLLRGDRPWMVYWMIGWIAGDIVAAIAMQNWQVAIFLKYLITLVDDLGPLFWVSGMIGVILPQFGVDVKLSWLMLAWMATAYFFGALFPAQRYLLILPGLPALAVAAALSWPRKWVWTLAAVQWACSLNYDAGWIPSLVIPTPIYAPNFLVSDPPRHEDWKIRDILAEVKKRRDPADPVANLTVVANDANFNPANFAWAAKLMEGPLITPRASDGLVSEFAQFVVIKNGGNKPVGDGEALSQAANEMLRPWFDRAYASVGAWPLPDNATAILYQRRAIKTAPFGARGKVSYQYYVHEASQFEGSNLAIDFGPWDAVRSQYERVGLSAQSAKYREVRLDRFAAELKNALAVPAQESFGGKLSEDVRFLKLGTLEIKSLGIEAEDLRQALQSRWKGWKIRKLELDHTVKFEAENRRLVFSGEAAVAVMEGPRRLVIRLTSATLGASPIPLWLLGRATTVSWSLEPTPEMPFRIEFPSLSLSRNRLSIP